MSSLSICFLFILFTIVTVNSEEIQHQVNLEDIEHDNVLSERKVQQGISHSTQYFRPPGTYQSQSNHEILKFKSQQQNIDHAPPSLATNSQQGEGNPDKHQQVQYITQNAAIHQDDRSSPYSFVSSAVPFTSARHSYTVHGRHYHPQQQQRSHQQLSYRPIKHPQSQLHTQPQLQPQFIYLQQQSDEDRSNHHQQQQHVAGGIQYASPEDINAYTVVRSEDQIKREPQQQEEIPLAYKQQHYQQQQHYQEQQPSIIGDSFPQYVHLVTRGPSPGETYIMMAPLPAGYLNQENKLVTIAKPILTYSHQSGVPQSIIPVLSIPQKQNIFSYNPLPLQGGVQYVNKADNHNQLSKQEQSNVIQDIQYVKSNPSSSSSISDRSKQQLFAPKHPERQGLAAPQTQDLTKLQTLDTHKIIPSQQQQQPKILHSIVRPIQPVQSVQIINDEQSSNSVSDFFLGRHPKSLLESYIPSWVVIQRQRSLGNDIFGYGHESTPLASNTYNTIAYSQPLEASEQGGRIIYFRDVHFKRSPEARKT